MPERPVLSLARCRSDTRAGASAGLNGAPVAHFLDGGEVMGRNGLMTPTQSAFLSPLDHDNVRLPGLR